MSPAPARRCAWAWLGRVDYARGLEAQERLAGALKAGQGDEALLLLEHPPVVTLGRGADPAHVLHDAEGLRRRGVDLFHTGRGGDVTFHGPGQLVGYPILNLDPDRRDVHRYVRDLEEVLIRTASDLGVTATRVPGLTGAWVGSRKLAAIGVRISRWVTTHGFAFNVATDLSFFDLIVPCGIQGRGVTSLADLLGREVSPGEVAARLVPHFAAVYGREMLRSTPEALLP